MKFSVDRAVLLKALAHVQSVVERRNTIPILANVLLEARESGLKLTATDMEIAVVEEVPGVTVTRQGRTTAPAATLYEIVRKLPETAKLELDHPGGDALMTLRAGRFDMLVTDIDMPRMNGIELVRLVRADARFAHLPIAVVSYKDREEDRRAGLDAGANAYLTKGSFQDQSFVATITGLVGAP